MTPDGDLFNPLDVGNGFAEFLINNPKRSYEVNPSEETYSSVFNQSNSESFTHGFDEYFRIYYEGDLTHSSTILKIRDIISTRPFIYLRYFEYYHTSLIHKDVTLSCLPGVETLLSDIPQKLSINSNDFFFVDQYIYGNEDYSLKSSEFGITLNAVAGLATVNALIVGQANAESDSEKYVGQGRLDGGTGLWTGSLTKLSDGSNGGRFSVAFFGPRAEEAALAIYLKSVPAHEGLSATLLAVGQRP
jgi:hypothetical protein